MTAHPPTTPEWEPAGTFPSRDKHVKFWDVWPLAVAREAQVGARVLFLLWLAVLSTGVIVGLVRDHESWQTEVFCLWVPMTGVVCSDAITARRRSVIGAASEEQTNGGWRWWYGAYFMVWMIWLALTADDGFNRWSSAAFAAFWLALLLKEFWQKHRRTR